MPFSHIKHKPPAAQKRPVTHEQLGRSRTDAYDWMKDENWQAVMRDPSRLSGDIRDHLEAENAYCAAVMQPLDGLKEDVFKELKARLEPTDASVPVPDGPYAYYHRYREGDQYGLYGRKRLAGDGLHVKGREATLLDADKLASTYDGFFDLGSVCHSFDHQKLAYSLDVNGAESYEIFICPAGRAARARSTGITNSTGSVIWGGDNRTLFWVERDENQRPHAVYAKDVYDKTARARLIYKEDDPGMFVSIGLSDSEKYILISVHDHTTSEIWLMATDKPRSTPVCFADRETGREYSVHEQGGYFYILTNAGGAVDFKVQRRRIDAPAKTEWEDVIAHMPGTLILGLEAYENFLVRLVRENALPRIIIRDMETGHEQDIDFDEAAFALGLPGTMPYEAGWLRFVYSSPTTPSQVFDYDMASTIRVLRKTQIVPSGHDPADYLTERVYISARDGAQVPVTILRKRDTARDGRAPLLLYGYGSYGITIPASFRTGILSLVDRGFIFAIAHIRGSMAKGYQWYLDGKLEKKQNTFTDFTDTARALIRLKYSGPGRIIAQGGSAGGLLVGAAVNEDVASETPVFGAVIAAVPFVDVLNTMSDETLPLTPPEWPEWGNPLTDQAAYDRLASYSPYDNVADAHYPYMFITGGLTDPRVTYWEPAKWAARLRAHQEGAAPILLKINMDAGHQGEPGRYDSLKETAQEYAFALAVMGKAS